MIKENKTLSSFKSEIEEKKKKKATRSDCLLISHGINAKQTYMDALTHIPPFKYIGTFLK